MIFSTKGTIECHDSYLIALVEKEIGRYFYSLIPKYKHVIPQRYHTHLTIVRKDLEPVKPWNHLSGVQVDIRIDTEVKSSAKYYWLDAYSKDVEKIRIDLGYPPHRGTFNAFHITIGNKKVPHVII